MAIPLNICIWISLETFEITEPIYIYILKLLTDIAKLSSKKKNAPITFPQCVKYAFSYTSPKSG